MPKKPHDDSRLAKYLEQRMLELKPRKTRGEIASEAGSANPNMITLLKQGANNVPLDRVPQLGDMRAPEAKQSKNSLR